MGLILHYKEMPMRRILVDSIKGSEKLARDIVNDNGTIIIANGTILRGRVIRRSR